MAFGAALLFYVGMQYWTMYSEQRRLAHEWEEQQMKRDVPGVELANDGLTRLSIPKINLNAVVVEGTDHKSLLKGPGHVEDTAVPGHPGNSVITGHRDTFFRHNYELGKGDLVIVQRNGKSFTYEVTGKKIVDPSDLSVLKPTSDRRLTLITCYPTYYIGPAPERLVVFTKLADDSHAELKATPSPASKSAGAASH
jgi:sortase A